MKFPELIFCTEDSGNGWWESDLALFSHIRTLHLYAPTKDLDFLGKFNTLKELYVHDSETQDWGFLSLLTELHF
ncbi:hypothetical protein NST84_09835 [Paenibacillus sp. FSL R7-0345]|uniref:hypothetical protein n=1 Tax=Paenibacillus sp. FSL R7-0345 TaxID=2954535 RepID=UPI003159C393